MVEIIINKQIIQVLDLEETIIISKPITIKVVAIILVDLDLVVEQTLVVGLTK